MKAGIKMNEFDSPNYTEYVYDKKAEGKIKVLKYLLIVGYVLFVLAFFLVCYITRFIPVFAICPLVCWILVFFTWRLVSFDVYYTFEHGHMEFGKVKRRKSGNIRRPTLKIDVQKAVLATSYENAVKTEKYKTVKCIYDYSSTKTSKNLLMIIFQTGSKREAVIFENTPKLQKLLTRYCPVSKDIPAM